VKEGRAARLVYRVRIDRVDVRKPLQLCEFTTAGGAERSCERLVAVGLAGLLGALARGLFGLLAFDLLLCADASAPNRA
jgi:hypothetical protein